MKNRITKIIFAVLITVAPLFTIAQTPPHPNGGNNPGVGNTPVGGAAPIDGGLSILLALGAGYGARKSHQLKK